MPCDYIAKKEGLAFILIHMVPVSLSQQSCGGFSTHVFVSGEDSLTGQVRRPAAMSPPPILSCELEPKRSPTVWAPAGAVSCPLVPDRGSDSRKGKQASEWDGGLKRALLPQGL